MWLIDRFHSLRCVPDPISILSFGCRQGGSANDGNGVAIEIKSPRVLEFHFDEFQQFFVVDEIALCSKRQREEHPPVGQQENVSASLVWDRPSRQQREYHRPFQGACNHVLDVIGVSGL
jgi:hypothetical protein